MSSSRPAIFSREAIHRAWLDCRRRKRGTPGAIAFEMRLANELSSLEQELNDRIYRPGACVRFATRRPKLREIVAAAFRDRVVHHLFVRAVEPDWERVFIHDSFACRRGKGTHAAVDRLEHFLRSATAGGTRPAYYLQVDVKSFFMSIDHEILLSRLDRRLRFRFGLDPGSRTSGPDVPHDVDLTPPTPLPETGRGESGSVLSAEHTPPSRVGKGADGLGLIESLTWLARLLVCQDPLEGCRVRGDRALLARVPPHKTLAGCRAGCGLPIGNLTSQFFANVYLDALDQFVKHHLRVRRYVRYVDDLVLIDEDRVLLENYMEQITDYLGRSLRLELNDARTRLSPVSSGIDFLGYVIHADHRLVRRRVVGNLRERLDQFEKRFLRRRADGNVLLLFPRAECDRLVAVVNSYLAHFARANTERLVASLWRRYPWLKEYLSLEGYKVVRRDRPRRLPLHLPRQYAWFLKRAGSSVLFFRVGNHYELMNLQAHYFAETLGLRRIPPRPGFRNRAGFRARHLDRFVARALELGRSVTVVLERRGVTRGVKERRIGARILLRRPSCSLSLGERVGVRASEGEVKP